MTAFAPADRADARRPSSPELPGRALARLVRDAAVETLWPTRCAVCDAPGQVLCDQCARALPAIDWWAACPRCGAPWGRLQCCECNPVTLGASGRTTLPLAQAASAVALDEAARAVVVTYKDRGERRLADVMAGRMAACVPPAWLDEAQAVTFVPASAAACRRRGFDHGALLAEGVAQRLGLPCARLLSRPRSADQRGLTRAARGANMAGSLSALPKAVEGPVIVTDDVCTTGATLCAAADALIAAGAPRVYALTFARA